MPQPDPFDCTALVELAQEPKVSLTAEAADRLTVSTFNALNAIATLFWCLVLLALAVAVPVTVIAWRAAF